MPNWKFYRLSSINQSTRRARVAANLNTRPNGDGGDGGDAGVAGVAGVDGDEWKTGDVGLVGLARGE